MKIRRRLRKLIFFHQVITFLLAALLLLTGREVLRQRGQLMRQQRVTSDLIDAVYNLMANEMADEPTSEPKPAASPDVRTY